MLGLIKDATLTKTKLTIFYLWQQEKYESLNSVQFLLVAKGNSFSSVHYCPHNMLLYENSLIIKSLKNITLV